MSRSASSAKSSRGRVGRSGELGAQTVEFALASTIFFMFIFGVIELCFVMFMYNTAAESARETSRWASVRGALCSNPNISSCPATLDQVQQFGVTIPGASKMTVQAWWCNSDGKTNCVQNPANALQGNIVKVRVSYTFAKVPFVVNGAMTVSSTSEAVIWQ
jgi:Flp pilus assembly protein TadG